MQQVTWKAKKTSQCPECRLLIVKFRHTVIKDYATQEYLHAKCFGIRQERRLQELKSSTGQHS